MSAITSADTAVTAQLRDLEERRHRALVAVDLTELDDLFDDSLVHIHSPGLTQNKQELLEHIAGRRSFIDVARGPLHIRVVGDIAIMVGPLTNHMRTSDGETLLTGVATQVALRSDGHWRFIHFQLTPTDRTPA